MLRPRGKCQSANVHYSVLSCRQMKSKTSSSGQSEHWDTLLLPASPKVFQLMRLNLRWTRIEIAFKEPKVYHFGSSSVLIVSKSTSQIWSNTQLRKNTCHGTEWAINLIKSWGQILPFTQSTHGSIFYSTWKSSTCPKETKRKSAAMNGEWCY